MGYIPSPRTPFLKIRQVQPGETIILNLDGGNKRNIKNNQKIIVENQNTDLNSLREIISQSVISSTVSDVDIGLLLSSGLDSNILLYELLEKV